MDEGRKKIRKIQELSDSGIEESGENRRLEVG